MAHSDSPSVGLYFAESSYLSFALRYAKCVGYCSGLGLSGGAESIRARRFAASAVWEVSSVL